jgi:hypothetical protein
MFEGELGSKDIKQIIGQTFHCSQPVQSKQVEEGGKKCSKRPAKREREGDKFDAATDHRRATAGAIFFFFFFLLE